MRSRSQQLCHAVDGCIFGSTISGTQKNDAEPTNREHETRACQFVRPHRISASTSYGARLSSASVPASPRTPMSRSPARSRIGLLSSGSMSCPPPKSRSPTQARRRADGGGGVTSRERGLQDLSQMAHEGGEGQAQHDHQYVFRSSSRLTLQASTNATSNIIPPVRTSDQSHADEKALPRSKYSCRSQCRRMRGRESRPRCSLSATHVSLCEDRDPRCDEHARRTDGGPGCASGRGRRT